MRRPEGVRQGGGPVRGQRSDGLAGAGGLRLQIARARQQLQRLPLEVPVDIPRRPRAARPQAARGRRGHTVRLGPGAGPLEGKWPEAVRLAVHEVIREVLDRHGVADVDVH